MLSDRDIRGLCVKTLYSGYAPGPTWIDAGMVYTFRGLPAAADVPMIEPYTEPVSGGGVISYGLTSYGYDLRVGRKFKVFTNVHGAIVDPKSFSSAAFVDVEGDHCLIPPNSFALAESVEWFNIPRHVLAVVLGKSTYARCGIVVNVTPLEPEWKGKVTIEISNTTPLPAKIYAEEGLAQVVFLYSESGCERSYRDKKGKYQNQAGLTLPRVL